MIDFLHHLFVPRESNNHRARLLHIQPLFLLVSILLLIHVMTPRIEQRYPDVLGISANISFEEMLQLTNQRRAEAGLPPLTMNSQLSQAAEMKAAHMMSNNYWAHNAPDGTTPWVFIKTVGYDYIYAGENLARGFTTASDTVNAWMASPGHRDNMLSQNYSDIGFAVITGNLTGDETVLVVEMFGRKPGSEPAVGSSQSQIAVAQPTLIPSPAATVIPLPTTALQPTVITRAVLTITPVPTVHPSLTPVVKFTAPVDSGGIQRQPLFIASINKDPMIDTQSVTRVMAIAIAGLFLVIFLVDMVMVEKKQIVRLVSHNIDHIMYLIVVLLTILLFSKGAIL
jgi:hypothetical protein